MLDDLRHFRAPRYEHEDDGIMVAFWIVMLAVVVFGAILVLHLGVV